MTTAFSSPGKVIGGLPSTPPRRTSWIPTSPSPLRNSFTTSGIMSNDDEDDDEDEEILRLQLAQIETRLALKRKEKLRLREQRKSEKQELPTLQVPQSPQKTPPKPTAPRSPQRVLLGIDRGKKASEVSLKNPWKPPITTPEKPKTTFADRLAITARENKRKSTVQDERERKKARTFSATAIASTLAHQTGSLQSHASQITQSQTTQPKTSHPPLNNQKSSTSTDQEEWCKYTGFNLRTRRLPQSVLKEEFKGKTTYSVSDLYRLVRPPNFDPPEYDTLDFLVTGIVAQKSPVRQVKGSGGNYLVVKITDLKMDIDLFLFGQAFQETWKLQKGMVIVLLNPQIYKQKSGKSFNLRMTSNKTPLSRQSKALPGQQSDSRDVSEIQDALELEGGESILEVGLSRDWAGCEALKADGTVCGEWVDVRHSRICAWHVDQGMKRARKGRMEYAVGIRPLSPERNKEKRDPFAPKKLTRASQEKPKKTSKPDSWDGGGGSVYHSGFLVPIVPVELDSALTSKKKVDGIKRDLKGSERERELRRVFKPFAPAKVSVMKTAPVTEETDKEATEVLESKAFDAKRLRGIGFDPRRKANEEVKPNYMERTLILPPRPDASEISLERIGLSGFMKGWGEGKRSAIEDILSGSDSDSDSDLDIVME